ncbi:branched-chain amino acid ABC transporter substrate-binding protein [Deinococcus humi]|uniref:Branched-chain amino acid transport system substrate-binding protein n=1 Tax=Deinococcus humi TaxID=662880 RepID=A0A7W8JRE0_9DEIO|nr:branched-chain amino acid ABC transporter substrate-binding protein [Deinococcus humi]MBB5361822.1 branched-chain amino acid transport system substrate-binding protein [Deinococcus humi]GGO23484.1 branched chain amino acid ABC transporter substrate-binding protein [Deinococcus humi]
MKRIILNVLTLGLLSAGVAGAQTIVKIASLSPLSGSQSFTGTLVKNGAQLAVEEQKAAFKKMGFDLQFVGYDDQADPATGTAAARKIASGRAILGVVGTMNSGVAIPASEALKASHVTMVSPAVTANEVTDRGLANMNRIVARNDAQGPAGAKFMMDELGAKSVYILNDKTSYGEGLAAEVEKTLKAGGAKVIANEGTEEKSDFSSIIAKIKLQKPDAVYFGGIYTQIGIFIRQLRDAGIDIPVVGGDGLDSTELATIAAKGANNIYYTTIVAPLESLPAAKTFTANYRKAYKTVPAGYAAFAYDSANVIAQGILDAAKANGGKLPTRTQVETAIRKGSFKGLLSGDVTFNSVGDRNSVTLYIMKMDAGKQSLSAQSTVKPPKQ